MQKPSDRIYKIIQEEQDSGEGMVVIVLAILKYLDEAAEAEKKITGCAMAQCFTNNQSYNPCGACAPRGGNTPNNGGWAGDEIVGWPKGTN